MPRAISCLSFTSPTVLRCCSRTPAFAPKTLRELIQLAKQTPGALNGTPEDFDRLLKREFQRWPRELKGAGIS